MTRVLVYFTGFSAHVGGSEFLLFTLIRALQRVECAVTVALQSSGDLQKVSRLYGIEIDMQITPELMKQNLLDWLASQSDLLYNGFLIVQIRDSVYSIKDTIRSLTDIDLETLAEGINTLDDFIELLDELGLGDKTLSVNLDMIPTLGLNAIYSGLNSLTDSLNSIADLATIGMNAVDVNVK